MQSDEAGHIITCAFDDLSEVSKVLEGILGEAESVKPTWKPQTMTPLDEDKAATMLKLLAVMDDDEDVQNVHSNFEVSDDIMEKLTAA